MCFAIVIKEWTLPTAESEDVPKFNVTIRYPTNIYADTNKLFMPKD